MNGRGQMSPDEALVVEMVALPDGGRPRAGVAAELGRTLNAGGGIVDE